MNFQIKTNVPLAPYTTWKIGGPADELLIATTDQELLDVVVWAIEHRRHFRILGAGSNTLVSDAGFRGLVVLARNDTTEWSGQTVIAGAGLKNGQLISDALAHSCGGLTWLVGVPGTIGGSIYGNAGSREIGLGDRCIWVEAINAQGQLIRKTKAECQFAYRESVFKRDPHVILRAMINLDSIEPRAEQQRIQLAAQKKQNAQPLSSATAGCIFRNPWADQSTLPDELRSWVNPDGTISAWRLINAVGLTGKQIGGMKISKRHANFLENTGHGTADQTVQIISLVKQQVRDKLGIQLQEEIQYLGFE